VVQAFRQTLWGRQGWQQDQQGQQLGWNKTSSTFCACTRSGRETSQHGDRWSIIRCDPAGNRYGMKAGFRDSKRAAAWSLGRLTRKEGKRATRCVHLQLLGGDRQTTEEGSRTRRDCAAPSAWPPSACGRRRSRRRCGSNTRASETSVFSRKGFRQQAKEKKRRATEVCNSPSWP
jgi:hypothetical protein